MASLGEYFPPVGPFAGACHGIIQNVIQLSKSCVGRLLTQPQPYRSGAYSCRCCRLPQREASFRHNHV